MGRKEARKLEKIARHEANLDRIKVSKEELREFKNRHVNSALEANSTALYICFAYALSRLYNFNQAQILDILQYIESLSGDINEGKIDFETIQKELYEKVDLEFKLR